MDLRGKRVTVKGLGRFGGLLGAVQFLVKKGAVVTVADHYTEEELAPQIEQLAEYPLAALHLGEYRESDFRDAELLIVNPAERPTHPQVAIAIEAEVPITTEIQLFWKHNRGRVIGVTGSRGKSTTAAITHALLRTAGHRCWLGGNIGGSLLPVVDEIRPDDWVVLELSSFMLSHLAETKRSPEAAIVSNFAPMHDDWHGGIAGYRSAKQNILRWQRRSDVAVLNGDDEDVSAWLVQGRRLYFGNGDLQTDGLFRIGRNALYRNGKVEELLPLSDWLSLPGEHNFQNALAACCCALSLGVELSDVQATLQEFVALPHRLQFVREIEGRKFYNDAISCNPGSTLAALGAVSQPIILLAGGCDQTSDYGDLVRAICERVKAVALYGNAGPKLERLIRQTDDNRSIALHTSGSFSAAFVWAASQSTPGDVVLLSPACASAGLFPTFMELGEEFMRLVHKRPNAKQTVY